MSSMEHPDTEQLSAYMHDPGADDYRQLRLHLISCVDCRQQVKLLSDLNINLGEVESEQYQHAVSENGELHEVLQSQLIEEYVDGQLNSNEQLRMKKMLSRNGQAMKAAMHYASHSGRMQRELASDSGFMQSEPKYSTGYNRPAKPGILTFLRRWLEVRTPIWLTVPATAAIAGILSVVLIPQINTASSKSYLIAYQDNPVIQFKSTQNLPGIGFFSRANKITKPYGRMDANLLDKKTIQLSWPKVDNAVSYTIQLKIFTNGKKVSVGKHTTVGTQASFERVANDSGHRYTWSLTGKTTVGDLFSTKGGFIINSANE